MNEFKKSYKDGNFLNIKARLKGKKNVSHWKYFKIPKINKKCIRK